MYRSPLRKVIGPECQKSSVPKQVKKFDWSAIPKIIAVVVPILYIVGRIYDAYFLQTYGASSALFPKSTQDYLFLAMEGIFYASYSLLSAFDKEWLTILSWALMVSAYVGLLLWIDGLSLDSIKRNKVRNFFASRLARIFGVVSSGPLVMVMAWGVISGVVIVLIVPIYIGVKSGQRVASEQIEKDRGVCAQRERKDPSACIVVRRDGHQMAIGRVIDASSSHVAIAVDGKAIIFARDGLTLEAMR